MSSQNNFEISWTWSSPKRGWLSTTVYADGTVMQGRQYSPATKPVHAKIGILPDAEVQRVSEVVSTALATVFPAAPGSESAEAARPTEQAFDLRRVDSFGARATHVTLADLDSHPSMVAVRRAFLRARRRAGGGYLSWNNVGFRIGIVAILLVGYMTYLTVSGSWEISRMQREAQRTEATVVARNGRTAYSKNASLQVRLTPAGASAPVYARITDSLSVENWNAAKPGATVRVWYHPGMRKAYIESDIERNISNQGTLPFLPLIFGIPALLLTLFLSRYRAGAYPDGKEFMMRGDRVVADGKAIPFSDSDMIAVRALIRLTT